MSRLSPASRILPAMALIATLLAAPRAGAHRPQALAACVPLPTQLVSPGGPRPVAARSTGSVTATMALDETAGHVYINTATALLALDATSGTCLRATPLDGTPGPVAIDGRTHRIFAARGSAIVAFDGMSGARLATIPAAEPVTSLLADPGGDRVLGVSDAELLVLDGRSGALLRRSPLPSPQASEVQAVALWAMGTLYVTEPRAIAVLDIASGARRAVIPLAGAMLSMAVDARTRHIFVTELPADSESYSLLAMFDAAGGAALH